mmetsp:Transcript_25/g.90  ORF Transcript_25/g.90 Transcript_25/m.90 type:complete len:160 (-) Transcript_25:575-1054(-)
MERRLRRANRDLLAIGEDGRLDRSAVSDRLLRRHVAVGLLVEMVAQHAAHVRHAGGAAHQNDLVHLVNPHAHALQHLLDRCERTLKEGRGERLVLQAREEERASGGEARRQLHGHASLVGESSLVKGASAVALVVQLDLDPLRLLPQSTHRLHVGLHIH